MIRHGWPSLGGCLDPLPCRAGGPYSQSGGLVRVVSDERELVVQAARGEEGTTSTASRSARCPISTAETGNWMTSTPRITIRARPGHQRDGLQRPLDATQKRRQPRIGARRAAAGSSRDPARSRPELSAVLESRSGLDAHGFMQPTGPYYAPSDTARSRNLGNSASRGGRPCVCMSNAWSARSEAVMPTACEHSFRRPAAAGMSPTLPNASGFARRISDDHIAVGSSETQSPDVRSARLSLESFGSPADHMSKTDISLLLSLLCALNLFLGAWPHS